jgi:hypothetical protein
LIPPKRHPQICFGRLEVRETTPCYDCGAVPEELEHLAQGRHTYAEVRVFGAQIVLCNFCHVDFHSYKPAYFGREKDVQRKRSVLAVWTVTL